jgi:hypothetical protein
MDTYDKKVFGILSPKENVRASVKRYSPYRHSSMSIENAGENETLINS